MSALPFTLGIVAGIAVWFLYNPEKEENSNKS